METERTSHVLESNLKLIMIEFNQMGMSLFIMRFPILKSVVKLNYQAYIILLKPNNGSHNLCLHFKIN